MNVKFEHYFNVDSHKQQSGPTQLDHHPHHSMLAEPQQLS